MEVKRLEEILGKKFTVKDLVKGYVEIEATNQVKGFGGLLDIRPEYQRKFVYDDNQAAAVIQTIFKNYPLNVMYWAVNRNANGDATYEVLDGQQRSISICKFVKGEDEEGNGDVCAFLTDSTIPQTFKNLSDKEKEKILDYELDVYVCEGTEEEKLQWFETINIAGEKSIFSKFGDGTLALN